MEKIKKIEIDVDGVLADLLNNDELKKMLSEVYPGYDEDCILEYDFENIRAENPIAAQIIKDSFRNATYMRCIPVYDGVKEGLERLSALPNLDICIHTLIQGGYDVIKARKEWIEDLSCNDKVRYQIDHQIKTMFTDSFVVIEDSPINLQQSTAKHKILIDHSYNKKYAQEHPEILVAKNFCEAVEMVEGILTQRTGC